MGIRLKLALLAAVKMKGVNPCQALGSSDWYRYTLNECSKYYISKFIRLQWAPTTYQSPSGNWHILSHLAPASFYKWGSGGERRLDNLPKSNEMQMNSKVNGLQSLSSVHCAALGGSGTFRHRAKFQMLSPKWVIPIRDIVSCLFFLSMNKLQNYEIKCE